MIVGAAALPAAAAFWAAAGEGPDRALRAAASGAALATGAALVGAFVAQGGAKPRVAAVAIVVVSASASAVAAAFAQQAGAGSGGFWLAGAVAGAWLGALAAAGAAAGALFSAGFGAACVVSAALVSLATPWWRPAGGSFVGESVVLWNPWLTLVGAVADTDWIRAPGLYPLLGAAYTPPVRAADAVLNFGVVAAASLAVAFVGGRRRRKRIDGSRPTAERSP